MSDVLPKPSKVSREGVLLIKSFEGFRPRAMQRSDGRWVIGYGHTQSAREGARVSEAEAELLMQYDLIPVVKAVTDHVRVHLNQHQFDALASFAFSIGADRFAASDVVEQLNAGSARQASASMSAWADEAAAETPTRRRSAEHALFNAAPGAPVTLADLLAAPLPSPFETDEPTLPAVDGALDEAVAPFPAQNDVPLAQATTAPQPPAVYAATAVGPVPDVVPLTGQSETVSVAAPIIAANDIHAPVETQQPETPSGFAGAQKTSVVLTAPGLAEAASGDSAAAPAIEGDAAASEDVLSTREVVARARAKRRSGLGETLTFVIMGGLGALCLGVAMAAFRRASISNSSDTATVAWVLILVAVACLGVSGYNCYRRWGRADRV
ncbi:glycoside hydrolase family protein [Brevundimonas vesicularis]|uniref:glycoside hydrolase family protein n=1 Tax=Brevundimonas vesicularis TaxID=41276 RepID=UPI0022EC281E|nr:glycoside hydrolase family protein [Brevundimonas vesicularis]WBT05333.1 glycoside hydrolase family protein [Brevundimonas vesicularis]